jgi:hypothetical protein
MWTDAAEHGGGDAMAERGEQAEGHVRGTSCVGPRFLFGVSWPRPRSHLGLGPICLVPVNCHFRGNEAACNRPSPGFGGPVQNTKRRSCY